jgi:hypothetical protein
MKVTGYLDHKTYAAMGIILGQRRGMKKVVPKPADTAPSTSPTP